MIANALRVAAAASALVVGTSVGAVAAGDPFGSGGANTWTLTGTCDGVPVVLTHPPGGSSLAFDDGQVSIAHRLVFYAADGVTIRFVFERGSYESLAEQGKLIYCTLEGSADGPPPAANRRVDAWVQVPGS